MAESANNDRGACGLTAEWPPHPAVWPEVMTDIEVCQYLRLDERHATPASAKRSLRHIRRTRGLPDVGRLGSRVLFRKAAVDAWLADRERRRMDSTVETRDECLR